jgi:DNA-binding NarL/FixJ family response regulator
VTLGKIGATPLEAKHCDIRIARRSAACAFLRTGQFCAAQSKESNIATSVQRGFHLLNRWRRFCDEGVMLTIYKRAFLPSASASKVGLRTDGGPVLQITPSERYALQLVAQGAPTSQIGPMLGLVPADTDPFLAALFARLGVASHADAIRVASRRGLLVP